MTRAREWPNNARGYRDGAAECNQAQIRQLRALRKRVKEGNFTRDGLEIALADIENLALRVSLHLKSAGAEILPE